MWASAHYSSHNQEQRGPVCVGALLEGPPLAVDDEEREKEDRGKALKIY